MTLADRARQVANALPAHKCELIITHNRHRSYYETARQWWESSKETDDASDWVSPEQFDKAMETDEVWILQWYPDTPVGFCTLYAADFASLVEAAEKMK